jgi:uncharacterized protein (DUF1800 family)
MALTDPKAGCVALTRFGYGPRGDGDIIAAAADPRGFLKAELMQPQIALLGGAGLPSTSAALQAFFAEQAAKKAERERMAQEATEKPAAAKDAMVPADGSMARADTSAVQGPPMPPQAALPSPQHVIFRAEAMARLRRAMAARAGLVERLVGFWSNHFCISAGKDGFTRVIAGAFEREAIRPFVLGRFVDMLKAVEAHPAMLHYLDNVQSIGPNSPANRNGKRGLNENLAREIMELHTLGVHGGYDQADVTSLARILTGWTAAGAQGRLGEPGTFVFNANAHEPGTHVLLAKSYPESGMAQGEMALEDLARHPATAHFVVGKFVRHFIADEPPPALVADLVKIFRATDGDLKALTLALIDADAAWSAPQSKMRTPYDFLIAIHRASGQLAEDAGPILGPLRMLGMPLWTPPGPNGHADTSAAWATPEGMKLRLDVAADHAAKIKEPPNPSELLDALCGPTASTETRQAVARAESKPQGLALLFMSPEFQRR